MTAALLAHVGSLPVEELLFPFLAGGGTWLAVAVRLRMAGRRRRGLRSGR